MKRFLPLTLYSIHNISIMNSHKKRPADKNSCFTISPSTLFQGDKNKLHKGNESTVNVVIFVWGKFRDCVA